MSDPIEIIFSTSSCGDRGVKQAIFMIAFLLVGTTLAFVLIRVGAWDNRRRNPEAAPPKPVRFDGLAILSLGVLGVIALGLLGLAAAADPFNQRLVERGGKIEVRGCAMLRPFTSNFDREEMKVTYRHVRGRRQPDQHYIILEQRKQRKVIIGLGNPARDRELEAVFPDEMKTYAEARQERRRKTNPEMQRPSLGLQRK